MNRSTNLFHSFFQLIHSAGIEEASYRGITHEINESNRRSLVIFTATACTLLCFMVFLSFLLDDLAGNRSLYLICAFASAAMALLTHGPARKNETITLVVLYGFLGMLMFFGILLGTAAPKEITATYIALLLTTPQLFIDRPWRMYLLILVSDIVFVVMTLVKKDPITWNSDIVNCFVFGCLSAIILTYFDKIRVERYLLLDAVRFMAENDQLTGLKNRNSYQMWLASETLLGSRSIFCVYVDVNGLHELNNAQGHAAGDRMLQYIANQMQRIFGSDSTYRIGGDEYVAIGTDSAKGTVENKISQLREAVESAGYHIAIGMAHYSKAQLPLESIISDAEKEMYIDKANYYARNNISHSRKFPTECSTQ